ncbi:MAG: apolipoprotein N-acyltransferase [Myxococcales bacterium]|nr:apolipoprotein N-acyltransferase [Myxococcales bacterium]
MSGSAPVASENPSAEPSPKSSADAPQGSSSRRGSLPAWLHRMLGQTWGRLLLSILSGTLLFLACADFDIWPLCWIGLVPLLWVLLDDDGQPRTRSPFFYGMVAGMFANGGGFYWIVGLLQRFGHLPWIAAAPLFLLLIAYQALTFGLFAVIVCRLRMHLGVKVTWLAPIVWVACELCVPYVFPWYLSITQAWVPTVIQIADITGPLGVSFLLVLSNGALFDVLHAIGRAKPGRRLRAFLGTPLLAVGTIVLCLAYGTVRIHQVDEARQHAEKLRVGVVQANVGIHEKFVPGLREQQHALHLSLSQQLTSQGAELILWPESSYPYAMARPVIGDFPVGDRRRVQNGFQTPIVFGALTVDRKGISDYDMFNTAIMLDQEGKAVGTFDKNFLLIFGEYLPFAHELDFLRRAIPEISNFSRGTETTTFPIDVRGKRYSLGPMICYEDIIPAFGRRLFADKNPPNLMVNITNDAWFGATSEPYEHLALAVFRAVEHRVELVRAVNTGVSAYIDAAGRVYQKGPSVDPQLQPDAKPVTLLADMALLPPGGLFQRLGETFGFLCLATVLLLGVLSRQRAGTPLRFGVLVGGSAVLHGSMVLGGLLFPSGLSALYAVLLHRGENALPEALVFAASWQMLLMLSVAAILLGAYCGYRPHKRPPTMELIGAICATTVLPVTLLGRMEGNTGAVVIVSGITVVCALLARRICARIRRANGQVQPS